MAKKKKPQKTRWAITGSIYDFELLLWDIHTFLIKEKNSIDGVMVNLLAYNAADSVFEPQSGQTKN
jgi:hypothetical protein